MPAPTALKRHQLVMWRSWVAAIGLFVVGLLPYFVFEMPVWWDWVTRVFGLAWWVALAATVSYLWRRWRWRGSG